MCDRVVPLHSKMAVAAFLSGGLRAILQIAHVIVVPHGVARQNDSIGSADTERTPAHWRGLGLSFKSTQDRRFRLRYGL